MSAEKDGKPAAASQDKPGVDDASEEEEIDRKNHAGGGGGGGGGFTAFGTKHALQDKRRDLV